MPGKTLKLLVHGSPAAVAWAAVHAMNFLPGDGLSVKMVRPGIYRVEGRYKGFFGGSRQVVVSPLVESYYPNRGVIVYSYQEGRSWARLSIHLGSPGWEPYRVVMVARENVVLFSLESKGLDKAKNKILEELLRKLASGLKAALAHVPPSVLEPSMYGGEVGMVNTIPYTAMAKMVEELISTGQAVPIHVEELSNLNEGLLNIVGRIATFWGMDEKNVHFYVKIEGRHGWRIYLLARGRVVRAAIAFYHSRTVEGYEVLAIAPSLPGPCKLHVYMPLVAGAQR